MPATLALTASALFTEIIFVTFPLHNLSYRAQPLSPNAAFECIHSTDITSTLNVTRTRLAF